jgi:hypothetical protein
MDRDIELPDTLLGDLFSTTSRILFSADTGLGKTMLGMAWAFALGLGLDFLHWRSIRKARVLYIDGEMPRDLMQERIELACEWFDVDPPKNGLKFLSREDYEDMEPFDTEDGQKWLDRFIEREGPFDFVVFDNIMSLCSAIMKEEDSWQALKPYALSLTKRHIGQLWLHHTGHDKSRAYGTKTREWQMDTVMVGEVVDQDHVSFNLNFTKARRRKPSNAGDFRNEHIELRDGKWIHRSPEKTATGRPNKSDEIALKALRNAIADADGPANEKAWKEYAFKFNISESKEKDARRMAFNRSRDNLIAQGKVIKEGEQFDVRT